MSTPDPVPVVNPTTFTITDTTATSEGVTGFNVEFGRASGVYTLKAPVPPADLITEASGKITGKLSELSVQLAAGIWFCAATAVSASGESVASPETSFSIVPPPPSPPTGFSVA
jgi:hypothetical protein